MYLYFSGRMIIAYRTMQRRGIRIGKPQDVKVKYVFLTLWGLTAAVAIVLAVAALPLA